MSHLGKSRLTLTLNILEQANQLVEESATGTTASELSKRLFLLEEATLELMTLADNLPDGDVDALPELNTRSSLDRGYDLKIAS